MSAIRVIHAPSHLSHALAQDLIGQIFPLRQEFIDQDWGSGKGCYVLHPHDVQRVLSAALGVERATRHNTTFIYARHIAIPKADCIMIDTQPSAIADPSDSRRLPTEATIRIVKIPTGEGLPCIREPYVGCTFRLANPKEVRRVQMKYRGLMVQLPPAYSVAFQDVLAGLAAGNRHYWADHLRMLIRPTLIRFPVDCAEVVQP